MRQFIIILVIFCLINVSLQKPNEKPEQQLGIQDRRRQERERNHKVIQHHKRGRERQLVEDRDEEIENISKTTEKVLKYLIQSVEKLLKELAVITRDITYNAANPSTLRRARKEKGHN